MRFLVKSARVWIVEEFVPKVTAWVRTLVNALLIASIVLWMVVSDWNPAPERADRPRPVELKFTPEIVSELVEVSLNTTFRLLPVSRLTPLYDESPASWSTCVSRLLKLPCSVVREAFAVEVAVKFVVASTERPRPAEAVLAV